MRGLCIAAGALIVGLASFFPIFTSDLFGHLAAGRQIVELGHVPDHDTFSFYFDTPRPWLNHNWLSGVILYAVHAALGVDGLVALKVVVMAALGALLVATTDRRWPAAALCVLILLWAMPSVRVRFAMRPHLFGLLSGAVLLYGLARFSRETRWTRPRTALAWLGGLAAVQVAWVNLHGSGPLAFVLTGAFLVAHFRDAPRRRLLLWLLSLQLLASCVTPYGPAILLETLHHVGSEGTRMLIGEWTPLSHTDNPWDIPFWAMVALLLAWSSIPLWRDGPPGRASLLVTAGMLVMAVRSVRFVTHAFMLGAPFVAGGVALRLAALSSRSPGPVRATLLAVAAVGALAVPLSAAELPPYQGIDAGLSTRVLPVQAGRWLARNRPRARVVGLLQDCWYLSYAVPQSKVVVDGRLAVYPLEVLREVGRALEDPAAMASLLGRFDADAVVLRHTDAEHAATIEALRRNPDFGLATVGDRHVLFVHGLAAEDEIRVLQPNLGLRTFAPSVRPAARRELARLDGGPGARAYVGLQRALLRLSDDLRDGGRGGLEPVRDVAARARYAAARADLRPALGRHDHLPTAQLLAGLLDVRLCRLDNARVELRQALESGINRQTIGLELELALAAGELDRAREMLGALEARGHDPWLRAIDRALQQGSGGPRCDGSDGAPGA